MKYHLHITSSDNLGMNLIENVIEMAALGAVMKPGTIPSMRFPQSVSMVLESDTPPTPKPCIRVFEYDGNKEVFASYVEPVVAKFSTEVDDANETTHFTKEQLDAMEWESEFKEVCKAVGITGRSRDKMTKEYLAKFA